MRLPDRYQPIRRIARGGMASVWCALDRTLDRHVAIKLLAEPYAHDQLAGKRFMREARAAARLSSHPNVVTIYDVGRAPFEDAYDPDRMEAARTDAAGDASGEAPPGRPFIVMEYLSGRTVADALRMRELDREKILQWLRQAATALDYAHHRGVIHRDVKLSNFMLDRDRLLHVADFGIALLGTEDTLTSSGQVVGTAAYLAPECALGLPATEASDRYALAVAAFELLVGERPFTAEHFAAQARQHVEEPVPRASQLDETLPAALDGVLARGMAKRQGERFGTAEELVDAIEQALWRRRAKRPMVAQPPAGAPPPVVRGRRARGRIAALAALAAVLVGVAVAAGATLVPTSSRAPRAHGALASHRAGHRKPIAAASDQARSSTSTAPRTMTHSTTSTTAGAPPVTTATALEVEGHQLMVGGDYGSAITVLRQAVDTAPRSSLTYAYALYDLGRSLRLAGDPRAAVPILWQRLQIPNQTQVVRNELSLALEALGQRAAASGGPIGGGGKPEKHHHGSHSDGQAGGAGSQGD